MTTLLTCSLATVDASDDVRSVHPRMPAILDPAEYDAWLAPDASERELKALLRPFRAGELQAVRVGPRVGYVRNDDPECLAPAA